MWGPPVISWFINPINYSYLRIINHSYWSYVHQLSYRKRGPHIVWTRYKKISKDGMIQDVHVTRRHLWNLCDDFCVTSNKELPFCVEHCATVLTQSGAIPPQVDDQRISATSWLWYMYISIYTHNDCSDMYQLCLFSTMFIFNHILGWWWMILND